MQKIFDNKKKLKSLSKDDFDFKVDDKIFINESLCLHYREILGRCNILYKQKLITGYRTANGVVKIQMNENGYYKKILHGDDLKALFPEFKFEF